MTKAREAGNQPVGTDLFRYNTDMRVISGKATLYCNQDQDSQFVRCNPRSPYGHLSAPNFANTHGPEAGGRGPAVRPCQMRSPSGWQGRSQYSKTTAVPDVARREVFRLEKVLCMYHPIQLMNLLLFNDAPSLRTSGARDASRRHSPS